MKRIIYIILILICSHTLSAQTWPSDNTPAIIGGFGTNEAGTFHQGIDIPGEANVTKVKAVKQLKVKKLKISNKGITFWFYLVENPEVIIKYAHCWRLGSIQEFNDFWNTDWKEENENYVKTFSENIIIEEGEVFATFASMEQASTTFTHIQLDYQVVVPNSLEHTTNILEPSSSSDPSVIPISNKDPGMTKPTMGPMFIKHIEGTPLIQGTNTGSIIIYPQTFYQNYSENPYLYNKIKIIREITDKMNGEEIDAAGAEILDNDAWLEANLPTKRFNGIRAAPYHISFKVKNYFTDEQLINKALDFENQFHDKDIYFGNNFFKFEPIDLLLDRGKISYTSYNNGTNPYLYCYDLMNLNIPYEPKPTDEYWSTKLKKEEDFGGDFAAINDEAKYPDSKYILNMKAKDLGGNVSEEDVEVIIDNFKPYIKKVTITEGSPKYGREWSWGENQTLQSNALCLSPFNLYVAKSNSNFSIEVLASEPMEEINLELFGENVCMIAVDNAKTIWKLCDSDN